MDRLVFAVPWRCGLNRGDRRGPTRLRTPEAVSKLESHRPEQPCAYTCLPSFGPNSPPVESPHQRKKRATEVEEPFLWLLRGGCWLILQKAEANSVPFIFLIRVVSQ